MHDGQLVRAADIEFVGIPAGKWRRYLDIRNMLDIFIGLGGLLSALFIVLWFWPNKVFIKGGYVGVPVGIAAWLLRRPIILHESDSVMGLANRFLSNLASKICVSFPTDYYRLPVRVKQKLVYTGVPIAPTFFDHQIGQIPILLNQQLPLILIMGGSQGARAINEVVKLIAPRLVSEYELVHLCGNLDYADLTDWATTKALHNYHLFATLPNHKVAELMKQAKLIISRAGATALAEISASGKPAILIPLPGSASDHQYLNAKYLADQKAVVLIKQTQASPELIIRQIGEIVATNLGDQLAAKIADFAQPDAAAKIADLLMQ